LISLSARRANRKHEASRRAGAVEVESIEALLAEIVATFANAAAIGA
jgi:hypothetical protein